MINEKNINSRIIHKHDIEANWNKATSFIPKQGELIVYDIDNENNKPRVKIGDGENTIIDLPFITPTVFEWAQASTKPTYTATEVGALPDTTNIPSKTSDLVNDSDFINSANILDANGTLKNSVLPEGYPYKDIGDILPETTIPIDPESGQGLINYEFKLYIGNSYILNYNGTEYNCEAKSFIMDNVEFITLGNAGVMDDSGETEITDEPFLLINLPTAIAPSFGCYGIVMSLDEAEEITLSIYGNIIKKISKEFLPNIPNINNVVDGSEPGSVRTIFASDVIGVGSHAEGYNATASGDFSHAEGSDTTASGSNSHAEGGDATASGSNSHAEGCSTASGDYSHAEGGSTASGDFSHAEGGDATASGQNSHAEGWNTTASGSNSHAEGGSTTASGGCSHAEGGDATASGYASHAEGRSANNAFDYITEESTKEEIIAAWNDNKFTLASGESSHAEGWNTLALGYGAHAEGENTTASGSNSHAEGNSTTASGSNSHAEGNSTTASGSNSHAEGNSTTASGSSAHAEGEGTTASDSNSHAEGSSTTASGSNSHAEGSRTTASGSNSHAEGSKTTASGNYSHAEGSKTTASGNYSHAEGYSTTASGGKSHAEGCDTTASGNYSHAEGYSDNNAFDFITEDSTDEEIIAAWNDNKFTLASGESSHAEGWNTLALGYGAHAEGENTTASGNNSHAEGYSTKASGYTSHAEGENTTASGASSHAEGYSTKASGDDSHAEGIYTTASGYGSHAEGNNTTASGNYSHVQGKYNVPDTNNQYAHIVGNGSSNSARSNAHTIDWNGLGWFAGGLKVGGAGQDDEKAVTVATINDIPTVPEWAKASTKPSYTKSEIGLGNVDNVKQYSAENPPVVVQSEAPTDTSVIWVDTDDDTNDGFQDAINIALAQAKASGEFAPVRGVDYWTVADQQSIVAQTLAALPTWEGGSY